MATSATTRAEASLAAEKLAKTAAPSLFADYAVLFKPRVSLMVLITAARPFFFGSLHTPLLSVEEPPEFTRIAPDS